MTALWQASIRARDTASMCSTTTLRVGPRIAQQSHHEFVFVLCSSDCEMIRIDARCVGVFVFLRGTEAASVHVILRSFLLTRAALAPGERCFSTNTTAPFMPGAAFAMPCR